MTMQLGWKMGMLFAGLAVLGSMRAMAQTDPSSPTSPGTSAPGMSSPGTSTNQTTPGVRRETAAGDVDRPQGSGGVDAQGMKDKIFLRKAAQGGLAEVQLGQLASEKASAEDV